ncbi:hypothetical protein [Mycolicibacterium sp.]|uniref:RNA polymerase factor sigma-54 n=1 Tax=Mycolicibacterium sp. TaxID=2320850 RepID=UPI0037CA08E9
MALLPLSQHEIADRIDSTLSDNPMLERAPGHPCPGCGRHTRSGRCRTCRGERADPTEATAPIDEIATLALCEVRADCRDLMTEVIAHLTSRGLLDSDAAEIARLHGVPLAAVRECIRALQVVGPPGIAEHTVGHLLAAQAERLVKTGEAPQWVIPLLRNDLDLVAARDESLIAERYSVCADDVRAALTLITRRLRPYSGGWQAELSRSHPPDVFVTCDQTGELVVEVPDSDWFGLRVADSPDGLTAGSEAREWLQTYQQHANILIHQVNSRSHLLATIAGKTVAYQSKYLLNGPAEHRRLTRSELAASLQVSESTVSRAVKDKYMRLPDGRVIPMRDLFGTAVAAHTALEALASNGSFSDRELSELLSARGYEVSRRTVAKYRAELGLAGCHRRNKLR